MSNKKIKFILQAPAAFGLVSFLLHEGVDRKRITRHLLFFSLSAPCLALVTYFGIGKVQMKNYKLYIYTNGHYYFMFILFLSLGGQGNVEQC